MNHELNHNDCRVCIGVPVYNGEKHLREAMDCLLEQTFKNFKIIIVNDGSVDGSEDIVEDYAAKDPRIHCIHLDKRRGMIGAWRQTFELAQDLYKPSYFAWYSDHDMVSPNWLECLYDSMENSPELVCSYAKTLMISVEGEVLETKVINDDTTGMDDWERVEYAALKLSGFGDIVYGLFRSDAMLKCGIFRNELMPDRLLVSEINIYGGIKYIPDAIRYRRLTQYSTDRSEMLSRQLKSLFPDKYIITRPFISHVTCLAREAINQDAGQDSSELRFLRLYHSWLYFTRNTDKFIENIKLEMQSDNKGEFSYLDGLFSSYNGTSAFAMREPFLQQRNELKNLKNKYIKLRALKNELKLRLKDTIEKKTAENDDLRLQLNKEVSKYKALKEDHRTLMRTYKWLKWFGPFAALYFTCADFLRLFIRVGPVIEPGSKILHVVPVSVNDEALHYHGSTKDIRGRTEYFLERKLKYVEMVVDRNDYRISSLLKNVKLPKYRCVIVDIPGSYPLTLKYLRTKAPHAKIMFRSHNAEGLHRMDYARLATTWRERKENIIRAWYRLWDDIKCMLYANKILSISEHDRNNYWRFLGWKTKSEVVPYFLPSDYVGEIYPDKAKKNICICLGAPKSGPVVVDSIRNFTYMVDNMGGDLNNWRFLVTGDTENIKPLSARIEQVGVLESPLSVLSEARAVAVLSDYGRGFKTKILEAINAGAYVLVTPKLYKRLPTALKPFCISVKKNSVKEFKSALSRCLEPFPEGDPNQILRMKAFETLDKLLGL